MRSRQPGRFPASRLRNLSDICREINWWQDLSKPLRKIQPIPSHDENLWPAELARLDFYLAVVKFVRDIGGTVSAAVPVDGKQPAAVLCWLPPNVRPSLYSLYRAGWFNAWRRFGVTGIYRFWKYEDSVSSLYARTLSPRGYRQSEGAFVQIIGTDPVHAGKGYSSLLLRWQIEQHFQLCPETPVFLDAAADYAQRVYERIGFRELGRQPLKLGGVDSNGFQITADPDAELYSEDKYVQRVMMLDCPSQLDEKKKQKVSTWGIRIGMVQLL